ncbi:L-rhamnose-binding lectin CSL2 [Oryzias melastigma]|uniref:L-rhamnose-binding lectin CSL2 n=1 Tax=Oryzias melastigma TaxID=30732 RepID=A0A834CSZ0_ORYME|nr:L-rhamnose-binding lectin CSL2 [Oryzias melastigma]
MHVNIDRLLLKTHVFPVWITARIFTQQYKYRRVPGMDIIIILDLQKLCCSSDSAQRCGLQQFACSWHQRFPQKQSQPVVTPALPIALECEDGVISVQSALYGRANKVICSEGRPPQQTSNTGCSQSGTRNFVKTRCSGKKVCEISTNDVNSPDPCTGTYKYLQTNFTCLPAIHLIACENSYAHLYCDRGQVISVFGADYGRQDKAVCYASRPPSQVENVYCSNPTQIVAQSCDGKNSCSIRVNNSVFGDPCVGTYKYLQLSYVCEYPTFG